MPPRGLLQDRLLGAVLEQTGREIWPFPDVHTAGVQRWRCTSSVASCVKAGGRRRAARDLRAPRSSRAQTRSSADVRVRFFLGAAQCFLGAAQNTSTGVCQNVTLHTLNSNWPPLSAGVQGVAVMDYLLLLVSITCASSGITWFALLQGNPVLKACWRMQLTVLIQLPLMLRELSRMPPDTLSQWKTSVLTTHLPTGTILGLHFWTVSLCVANTSLSHAILLVNAPPLFLVLWATGLWIIARIVTTLAGGAFHSLDAATPAAAPPRPWASWLNPAQCHPPTVVEVVGACVAFAGVSGLVSAAGNGSADEDRVTLRGDLIGLLASASLAFYFAVGGSVRKWCPLFSWLCPLHISASVTTALIGLLFVPGTTVLPQSPDDTGAVLSWVIGGTTFWYSLGAACVPGMLGHGLANHVIGRLGGLVVSVTQLLQPVPGMLIGYLAGVQGPPGIAPLLCAPVILYGAFLVTVGGRGKGLTWQQVLRCRIRAAFSVTRPAVGPPNALQPPAPSVTSSSTEAAGKSDAPSDRGVSSALAPAALAVEAHDDTATPRKPGGRVGGSASDWGSPLDLAHVRRMLPLLAPGFAGGGGGGTRGVTSPARAPP